MRGSAALLIVGHGSTVNPDSSAPTLMHARAIRNQAIFREVACAFWKEEPSLRDARFLFPDPGTREVYVVPNFISEGYFTETVIPRELELSGRITTRSDGQIWKYCEPIGNHPLMTELLLQRAVEAAANIRPEQTSLLIVAHGTDLNDKSAVAAKRQAEKIARFNRYAAVMNVYMEEAPLVSDWARLTSTPNVVVVPFFISDGLHSYEDIPVMLGIASEQREPVNRTNVPASRAHQVQGRTLFYGSAIGTDPRVAEIMVEQTAAFDRRERDLHSIPPDFETKV
jgi:sirohydrochlorin cobaltochelatase